MEFSTREFQFSQNILTGSYNILRDGMKLNDENNNPYQLGTVEECLKSITPMVLTFLQMDYEIVIKKSISSDM